MIGINVTVLRFVDESRPGWVECGFIDARNQEWTFVEKVPMVTSEDLDADSSYPACGVIACEVVERHLDSSGREVRGPGEVPPDSPAGEASQAWLLGQELLLRIGPGNRPQVS